MMTNLTYDTLYQMDYREFLRQLPDGVAGLILTDPPYGIHYQNQFSHKQHRHIEGDDGIDYATFAFECYRVLQDNAHAYIFTRFDQYPEHYRLLRLAGFHIKNCLVVEKGNLGGIGDLTGSYANNAEWIIFCQKGRRIFNRTKLLLNQKQGRVPGTGRNPVPKYKMRFPCCWFGEGYPKATYNSGWQKKNGIYHPTVKNVECLEWLIKLSSEPKALVVDPFMGVASTALAAIHTGRHFVGSEIDIEYYQKGLKRISRETEVIKNGTGTGKSGRPGIFKAPDGKPPRQGAGLFYDVVPDGQHGGPA